MHTPVRGQQAPDRMNVTNVSGFGGLCGARPMLMGLLGGEMQLNNF